MGSAPSPKIFDVVVELDATSGTTVTTVCWPPPSKICDVVIKPDAKSGTTVGSVPPPKIFDVVV